MSDGLKLKGISISPPTVQKIWNERALGGRYERWLSLEDTCSSYAFALLGSLPVHDHVDFRLDGSTHR